MTKNEILQKIAELEEEYKSHQSILGTMASSPPLVAIQKQIDILETKLNE